MNLRPPQTASRRALLDVFALAGLVIFCACSCAQAAYTASRAGELQFGGSFGLGRSNYLPVDVQSNAAPLSDLSRTVNLLGGGAYGSFDMKRYVGAGLDFRRLNARGDSSAQTSIEASFRYTLFRGFRFAPYLQAGFGHGWYRYPQGAGTLGHNLYGLGGGLDYHLSRSLNLRGAYEYQSWIGVPIRNPQPQTLSVGIAYRFH